MEELRILIENIVRQCLNEEGRFAKSPTPHNSRSHRERNVANPIISHGNGNHSNQDVVSQVSTYDDNGANFESSRTFCISDKNFLRYKWSNFNNTRVNSTMDFFGGDISKLRLEIDRLNGAAMRNGRQLIYRTITSESYRDSSERSGNMLHSFWEFSFDGNTWYLMMPNGVDRLKKTTMIAK